VKKLTILLVIIFSFLFSTTSWGDWNYFPITPDSVQLVKYYYDKDKIRKSGKFIYFWQLLSYKEPFLEGIEGVLSFTTYIQLECSIFRFKMLKYNFYSKSMGEGELVQEVTPTSGWEYPEPKTIAMSLYEKICEEHQ